MVATGEDARLLSAYRSGDAAAFEAVFRRHYQPVLRLATRRLNERTTAEEIAQESFIRLIAAATTRNISSPGAYVRQVAHNLCTDFLRSRRLALAPLNDVHPDPAPSPLDSQLTDQLREQVHMALERLKPKQRKALVLWGFEHRSYNEVGEALGVSQRAAEGLIARARQRFRTEYERCVKSEDVTPSSKESSTMVALAAV